MSNGEHLRKRIECYYNGKLHNLTAVEWVELLKDEPIHQHLKAAEILSRYNQKRYTTRQSLGLDEIKNAHNGKSGKSRHFTSNKDQNKFEEVNAIMRTALGRMARVV